ncbi:MAG: S-adenosylmethionine:tRNA ribosyltransferase-isomerase [Paludibacteraceae bacterium]|nr:S-adenosylmethionine:tRNA ribosyltransferase-isomerase [Paludibacteraceae bacterium]
MNGERPIYIADYDYPLPDERIAKYPLPERDTSKLLVYKPSAISGQPSVVSEDHFYNVGDYIQPGSLLIYNNTRVIQARLVFHKAAEPDKQGARIEVFCLEPIAPHDYQLSLSSTSGCTWKCMIGNAKKWKEEAIELKIENGKWKIGLRAYKEEVLGNTYAVRFEWDGENVSFAEILDAIGELPIPPYLNRKTEESDKTTYQTVYSRIKGSVAAPTAGLHFTDRVLDDLRARGIETDEVTLHVGAGTFLPVKTEDANEHVMHSEFIAVPRQTIAHIQSKLGHIVAVGTTSMRTLESLYFIGRRLSLSPSLPYGEGGFLQVGQFEPYEEDSLPIGRVGVGQSLQAILDWMDATGQDTLHAATQIMIKPGYRFRIVDQLITNFHQPKSTLLLLVSAFVGGDWKTIYDYALSHDFRFLSYGDSSILTRSK